MSDGVLIALVTGIIGLVAGVVLKLAEKFFSKAKDQADEDESRAAGLRVDLERKDLEISNYKTEVRELDSQIDLLKAALDEKKAIYWALFDKFMRLRIAASTHLMALGKTEAEVEEILPAIPDTPNA